MKKLLLVLMVVAMASFLFVGCLPGVVVDNGNGEDEDEGEPEVQITIAVDKEYTNAAGVTFVGGVRKVTVTLPTAVETDYVVYVAKKFLSDTDPDYIAQVEAKPNADRTVWTVAVYDFSVGTTAYPYAECEAICIVALVKHPCCPGEEVALRVVTVDKIAPVVPIELVLADFYDCADVCVEPDPCDPVTGGAYFKWSSLDTSDPCETIDACTDACSGVGTWKFVVDPGECDECVVYVGSGCPVEGTADCGCLAYSDGTPAIIDYTLKFTIEDNVGNSSTASWTVTVDTDEVTTVTPL